MSGCSFLDVFSLAHAEPPTFQQQMVAPVLEPTQRGSLAGELASFARDGSDLMKGAFTLPLPIHFPEDRGRLVYPIQPSYSITQGMSEWGIGWANTLAISRFRRLGYVQYAEDSFASPWGTLLKGEDGFYYPEGMHNPVRLKYQETEDLWTAFLPNGDELIFGGDTAKITTAKGTYSWYLTQAQSITQEQSLYHYRNPRTESQQPILTQVQYGGRNGKFQYQIDLQLAALRQPSFHYRSGEKITLSQRIEKVTLSVLQGATLAERFSYHLGFQENTYGPGFRLISSQKHYASGAQDLPYQLDYELPEEVAQRNRWRPVPSYTPFVERFVNALMLGRNSVVNENDNGLTEIETTNEYNYTRLLLKEGEYQAFELPPYQEKDTDNTCRLNPKEIYRTPRLNLRMRGKGSPIEVVGIQRVGLTRFQPGYCVLHVCDKEGHTTQTLRFEGDIRLGPFTKLVDLANNGKPDIVSLYNASISTGPNQLVNQIKLKILKNTSTPEQIAFEPIKDVTLNGNFQRDAGFALFQDLNGDGILDLIIVRNGGISVWFGKGNYEFELESKFYPFQVGPQLGAYHLYETRIHFQDLNGDGLPEAIVQRGFSTSVFMNQGDSFKLLDDSPIYDTSWSTYTGKPFILDFLGTGNLTVAAKDVAHDVIYAIELSSPGMGLLRKADDGKGNQVEFSYKRVDPNPWIGYRFPVIDKIRSTVSGEGTREQSFEFSKPTHHSFSDQNPEDRGFLGFSKILSKTHLGESISHFQYGDEQPGVLVLKEEHDFRSPDLWKFLTHAYQKANTFGFDWLRLESTETGYRQNANTASQITQYQSYEKGVCPTRLSVRDPQKNSLSTLSYSDSAALASSLHCLLDSMSTVGYHTENAFDFQERIQVQRNSQGLPVEITRLGNPLSGTSKTLQKIDYTPDFKVHSITVPGSGTSLYGYDPQTTLLSSITSPTGVVLHADRDPLLDQIQELREDHGDGKIAHQHARYDGFERLQKSWSQLTSDLSRQSEMEFLYTYATPTTPGIIQIFQKSGNVTQEASVQSGSGLELAHLADLAAGAVWTDLKSKDSHALITQGYAPKVGSYLDFIQRPSYEALYAQAVSLRSDQSHFLGLDLHQNQTYQTGVAGKKESSYSVQSGSLFQNQLENDSILWTQAKDPQGQITLTRIPDKGDPGIEYQFERDALGRVVRVRLPIATGSPEEHRVQYNELGELSKISRTGLGSILFTYASESPLLENKKYFDEKDQLTRSIYWTYDPQGRKTSVRYRDDRSGQEEIHRFYYDGAFPNHPDKKPGQKGRLSAIEGPFYEQNWIYREDGKVIQEELKIPGFGDLLTDFQYDLNGHVQSQTFERKGKGTSLKLPFRYERDTLDREFKTYLNDALLYQVDYNAYSQVARLESLSRIELKYDPTTQKETGYTQQMGALTYQNSWNLGPRGLIESEKFQLGQNHSQKSYLYNDAGLLTETVTDDHSQQNKTHYGYNPQQLLNQFESPFQNDGQKIKIPSAGK